MKYLNLQEIETIAYRLAQTKMTGAEPIPAFDTRFPNVLERCLAAPRQNFAEQFLYPTLLAKAAILFYLLIKNHPFQNGNKRIAMASLLVFLFRNRKWIKVDQRKLYEFAMWVAQSPASFKDETLKLIVRFLADHLIDLK
ncbi:MAG: type II toxin-antitoxin system death-on-curing family toxin [Patescibacteria group bacterium]|jgi:death-on-curing family protein